MRLALSLAGVLAVSWACGGPEEPGGEREGSEPGDALGVLEQPVIGGSIVPVGRWDEVSSHDCSGVFFIMVNGYTASTYSITANYIAP